MGAPRRLGRGVARCLFAAALLCVGCGGAPPSGLALRVDGLALSERAHFSLDGSFGGPATVADGSAQVRVAGVPEGRMVFELRGYAAMPGFLGGRAPPGRSVLPGPAWCTVAFATVTVDLVAGVSPRPLSLTATELSSVAACQRVTAERFVLAADYTFEAQERWAGSLDGSNVTRVFVDGLAPGSFFTLRLGGGAEVAGGLFPELPPPGDWPDPITWPASFDGIADDDGDAVAYLVARPEVPAGWFELELVQAGAPTPTRLSVRISGVARLDASLQ